MTHISLVQALSAHTAPVCDCCKVPAKHRIAIHADPRHPPAMLCAKCAADVDFDEIEVTK